MKRQISILIGLVSFMSIAANAQTEEIPTILTAQHDYSGSVLAEGALSYTQPFSSAPPLTELYVYAVASSDCGVESTIGKTTTDCNHGGALLESAVLEIGYGGNPIVWMSGGVLPSSAQTANIPVCLDGVYYYWPCSAGDTIVGAFRVFNLSGHQNGLFRYQNTSLSSPFNTMSTQISIL